MSTAILAERKLVRTATVGLTSTRVDRVLDEVEQVVATHRGIVESEDVRTDDKGAPESADIVLRVPVERFETAVADIAALGRLAREETSTVDVTARVADVNARVANAERSIAQLRRLFSRAGKLADVIALESELTRRQAELEALQARLRALSRQTTLSTIHVSVTKPARAYGPGDDRPPGFLPGLESGWSALVAFVRGATHVVGVVLPFLVLVPVIAVPAWLVLRRFRLARGRTAD